MMRKRDVIERAQKIERVHRAERLIGYPPINDDFKVLGDGPSVRAVMWFKFSDDITDNMISSIRETYKNKILRIIK